MCDCDHFDLVPEADRCNPYSVLIRRDNIFKSFETVSELREYLVVYLGAIMKFPAVCEVSRSKLLPRINMLCDFGGPVPEGSHKENHFMDITTAYNPEVNERRKK